MRTALSRVPVRISARRPPTEPWPLTVFGAFSCMARVAARDGISHHSASAAASPRRPIRVTLARQLITVSSSPTNPGIRVLPMSPAKLYWDSASLTPPPASWVSVMIEDASGCWVLAPRPPSSSARSNTPSPPACPASR